MAVKNTILEVAWIGVDSLWMTFSSDTLISTTQYGTTNTTVAIHHVTLQDINKLQEALSKREQELMADNVKNIEKVTPGKE